MGGRTDDGVPDAAVGAENQHDPNYPEGHTDVFPRSKNKRKSYGHRQNSDFEPASVFAAFPMASVDGYSNQKVRYCIAGPRDQYYVAGKTDSKSADVGEIISEVTRKNIPCKQGAHTVAGRPCELIRKWDSSFFRCFFFHNNSHNSVLLS